MTLRRRLTLWYGGILAMCLALLVWPLYHGLLAEFAERSISEALAKQDFWEIVVHMAWLCLPSMVLGLLAGAWIVKRSLRPLEKVIEAAEGLTDQTLSHRLPVERRDAELARLAEVFDAMAARLEASFTRVRDFSLHASHELKTPMSVLRCGLEAGLREWTNLEPAQRDLLAAQVEEVERLARLVDDLGTLSKADAGQLTLARKPVELKELLEEMAENAESLARPLGISVALTGGESVIVQGDRHRLRQVLLILVDNAIKHNITGGRVDIGLRRKGGEAVLTVNNTGPGLSTEYHHRVFERFFRGPDLGGHTEGCGLGLAIALWIVSAHEGDIRFHSVPGELTTVELRLPAESGPPEQVEEAG